MARKIFIGDVHGCLDELKLLLDKLNVTPSDYVCIVGDLIDRGPDSPGVIRFCMEKGIDAIQGNHDAKMLRRAKHMERAAADPRYRNPMKPSEDQENTVNALDSKALRWVSSLPYFKRFPEHNLVIVHAGLLPRAPIERQSREVMTMVRYIDAAEHRKMMPFLMPGFRQPEGSVAWTDVYDLGVNVVYGHHVHSMTEPFVTAERHGGVRCYGIDTGCVFGGRLTAAVYENDSHTPEFVQVNARKAYYERTAETNYE